VSAPRIAIVDYGMGNRRSVEKAFQHVGAVAVVTRAHDELRAADGLVVPGVGAFPLAMRNLRALGLDRLIWDRVAEGTPVLGICLGMQLAFDGSTEAGGDEGLGIVPGGVEALEAPGLKLPHIGWNGVRWRRRVPEVEGLPETTAFYHVHTYAPRPTDHADVLGTGEYGAPFVSAVARGSFTGVQFHPEKSSAHGLALLRGFAARCAPIYAS
jgi:imidazole glycerol-phosphate synthase subunit HisH